MKKGIICLLALLLLLTGCSSGNSTETEDTAEEEVEEVIEPIGYSDPIYVVTTKTSGIKNIEDLEGKRIAIQTIYDREASDYVLRNLGVEGIETVESYYYQQLPDFINNNEIDAWIISKGPHELLYDYRHDYDTSSYVIVGEYKIPYYEEEQIEPKVLSNTLLQKPFAVMLNGLDERGDPDTLQARNDVNILMVVDPLKHHVLTIGFPRDSYIRNACTGYSDKLTHFNLSGETCVKDSMASLLGIDVDYFVNVSFSSFVDLINTLGGVEVDVPLDMCMDQDSYRDVKQPYCLVKGKNLLYGEWALALARNRKYDGIYNGDYGRIRNQQLIVNAIIDRIANNPVLINWAGLTWKADELANHNFDMDLEDITALFYLAESFADGYTIDNYFIENVGSTTESGMSIGLCTEASLEVARLKAKYVLTGEIDKDNYYYEAAMTGYVTGGAGNYTDQYIGESYDLN